MHKNYMAIYLHNHIKQIIKPPSHQHYIFFRNNVKYPIKNFTHVPHEVILLKHTRKNPDNHKITKTNFLRTMSMILVGFKLLSIYLNNTCITYTQSSHTFI